MKNKYRLLLSIIDDDFGDIAKEVANYLLTYEQCSLVSICRNFIQQPTDKKLSSMQVKEALLLLCHHNCIDIQLPSLLENEEEIPMKDRLSTSGILYRLNEVAILRRLRFSTLLLKTKQHFGEIGSFIMEEIILHSRLTTTKLIENTLAQIRERALQDESLASMKYSEEDIKILIGKMAQKRFLVSTEALLIKRREPLIDKNAKSSTLANLNIPTISRDTTNNNVKSVIKAKRKRASSVQLDASGLPPELLKASSTSASSNTMNNSLMESHLKNSDAGRSNLKLKSDPETILPEEESSINNATAWIIGWDQLIREERSALCIYVTKDRMELLASFVVKIILEYSTFLEVTTSPRQSFALSLTAIHERLKLVLQENKLKLIDINTLKELLDTLIKDELGAIEKLDAENNVSEPSYCVNYHSLISFTLRKTRHQMCVSKFGVHCGRIYELLNRSKYLEQQEVSDLAIIPAREARENLYTLYKHGWVNFLELSKRTDFIPSAVMYFWHIDEARLEESLLDSMYQGIYNLKLRRFYEEEKYRKSLSIDLPNPSMVKARGNVSSTQSSQLLRFSEMHDRTLARLDQAIINMDKMLMLFTEFIVTC